MKCKKCGEEQLADAIYCGSCGEHMRQLCAKCQKPISDGVKFCTACGMPSDSVLCESCGCVVSKEQDFCSRCGARKDVKRVCLKCSELLDRHAVFCGVCAAVSVGAKQRTELKMREERPPSEKLLRGGKLKDNMALKLSRVWVSVGIFAFLFLFSFFAFAETSFIIEHNDEDRRIKIVILTDSPFDAIGSLFGFWQTTKEIQSEINGKVVITDENNQVHKLEFNIFRLQAATAVEDKDAIVITYIALRAVMPLLLMAFCLVGLMVSLVTAIRVTTGKGEINSKSQIKWLGLIVALVLCMLAICRIGVFWGWLRQLGMISIMEASLNGFAIAMIVFAVLGIVMETVAHFLLTDARIDIFRQISQGISIIFFLIILVMLGSGANLLYYNGSVLKASAIELFSLVKPIGEPLSVLALVNFIFLIILIMTATLSVFYAIKRALNGNLKVNAISSILMLLLAIILIVFYSINIGILERRMANNQTIRITTSLIPVCILCVLNAAQTIVLMYFAKKEKNSNFVLPLNSMFYNT